MSEPFRKASDGDIVQWADGSWCFHEDLSEYGWMSDDFIILPFDSIPWAAIMDECE